MATQEDRSLSGGMFIPTWMKNKINHKLDIATTAYSPTELDDSFMIYYRNTRGTNTTEQLNKNINNQTTIATNNLIENNTSNTVSALNNKPNFAKHTLPCQKFLHNGNESTMAQHVAFPTSNTTKIKSSGIDDGFKGEAAKCGSSVIRVAQQIVSGKLTRGFNITKSDCPEENQHSSNIEHQYTDDLPPAGFNPSLRRGSKSLPASPLTSPNASPKTKRRVNKYFTGPFLDADKHHGWILSNLLSQRKAVSQSVDMIAEEDSETMKKASSNISIDETDHHHHKKDLHHNKKEVFVAKPSELREMNFWSPTSM